MKKLCFLLLLALVSFRAAAQTELKISPVALLIPGLALSVEQGLTESWGLDGDVFFAEDAFYANLSGKYYFNPERGIDRFHIGLFGGGNNSGIGIGFLTGYKVLSRKNFLFEAGLGIGRGFDDAIIGYAKLHIGFRLGRDRAPEAGGGGN